jgi:hypothetical protein
MRRRSGSAGAGLPRHRRRSPPDLHGTAPLFDLTAATAEVEAGEPAVVSRSQELLASIQQRRSIITDQEIATVREIAEWLGSTWCPTKQRQRH